jgi:HAMP domain-containing protein
VALALTLAAFAAVLYVDRRSASYQDLDRRIQSEASLTAGILAESYRARGVLVRQDTAGRPVLIGDLGALLEAVPDFLIITAHDGSLLFASSDARALTFQQVEHLRRLASAPVSARAPGVVRLEPDGPKMLYAVHDVTEAGPQFGAILAGANVRSAELGPDQLLSTFALTLPLALVAALLMGTWIASRALGAVDQIITEVREITDGRSLHRRLAEPLVQDELGRLAETLNQMMTRLERSFAALRRFTAVTGRQPAPSAAWQFGPWFQTGQPNTVPPADESSVPG